MKDLDVEPSQGSHFFQNLTSFSIGYFTIKNSNKNSFLDWNWLELQKINRKLKYVRHVELQKPLEIKINAHKKLGVILKS